MCCAKALNHKIFLPGTFDKLGLAVFLHAFWLMTRVIHNEGTKLQPAPKKIAELFFSLCLPWSGFDKSSGLSFACLACSESGSAQTSSSVPGQRKMWGRSPGEGASSSMGKDTSARRQKESSAVDRPKDGGMAGGVRCLQGPGFRRKKSQKQPKPKRDGFHLDLLLECAMGCVSCSLHSEGRQSCRKAEKDWKL